MRKSSAFALGLILCVLLAPAGAQASNPEGPLLVGRITFIEGQLLRYVYDEQDWVATVKDAPFGQEDAVYSGDTGKAEFKMPDGVWVRTGSDTQMQVMVLGNDLMEIDVASGTARFYNKSQKSLVKVTTPFGYVLARQGTAFDLYVGDDSAEIISLDGKVDFIVGDKETRHTVEAGGASIISDGRVAVLGDGKVDASWDEWNLEREELWTQRVQVRGESIDNLPADLRYEAFDLDRSGKWVQVYYEGAYRKLWRPAQVAAGWQPFTGGRWTVWREDNVWIPGEPFGYVTHHYGNWVYTNSAWYWAPPEKGRTGAGSYSYWYPGRVSWIHSSVDVGWVPLAPSEVYYSNNYWGPGSSVVRLQKRGPGIVVDRLAYAGHATIVPRSRLYSVNSYTGVRVMRLNRGSIIGNYRAAPVISDRVMPNYSSTRNRYVYNINMAHLAAKPHNEVADRINRNLKNYPGMNGAVSAVTIQKELSRMGRGKPLGDAQAVLRVQQLRVTSRLVPENMVNRPRSEIQFNQRALKSQEKQPQRLPIF